jgi:hypothetical protein
MARQILVGDELALAQSAASYTSWSLFLEFLARPAAALWEKLSYLYTLALPGQLQPVSLQDAVEAVRQICQDSAAISDLPGEPHCDGLGGSCSSDEVAALTLVTNSSVKERNAAGVFLLVRFDDDRRVREPDFPRHWRGFLRLMNRLQFLPLAYIVTVRGCRSGAFSGITDAYRHFLAGGQPPPAKDEPQPGSVGDLPPDFDLANPSLASFLEQVLQRKLAWPVIGFELEANGRVAATAEAAWPDRKLAVFGPELATDQEIFGQAGWRVFAFGAAGLASQEASTIITILAPQT